MAKIILDNHDILGKLSVVKNALFVALEKPAKEELIKTALKANQDLIDMVKKAATNVKDLNY